MTDDEKKEAAAVRAEKADQVLDLLLEDFLHILSPWTDAEGKQHPPIASPTDRATIARFLKDNGYSVDVKNIPQNLAEIAARAKAKRNLMRVDPTRVDG